MSENGHDDISEEVEASLEVPAPSYIEDPPILPEPSEAVRLEQMAQEALTDRGVDIRSMLDDPRDAEFCDIDRFQMAVREWSLRNFGEGDSRGFGPVSGVSEEMGELAETLVASLNVVGAIGRLHHAHLKGHQGIRHTPEEILDKKMDAIGDILVYLADYASREGISLYDCIGRAWGEVRARDWVANKQNGQVDG